MREILIKGMEMPKYCCHCRFESSSIHGQYCILTKRFTRLDDNEDGSKRHISCPLVEVPTHGRLIDADVLMKTLKEVPITDEKIKGTFTKMMCDFAIQILEKSATVIEASTEERE